MGTTLCCVCNTSMTEGSTNDSTCPMKPKTLNEQIKQVHLQLELEKEIVVPNEDDEFGEPTSKLPSLKLLNSQATLSTSDGQFRDFH